MLILNLMPATHLKIVGTGACLPWCSICSSFQNLFSFCCWNLVPFLPDICSSCWRVCGCLWRIFRLMMRQMFSIGERSGLQAGQFSTRTLQLRSHAVVIAAVCCFALSSWYRRHLEGSICCSKTFIAPSKTCKLPIPHALMHPHTIRDAGFWTECW